MSDRRKVMSVIAGCSHCELYSNDVLTDPGYCAPNSVSLVLLFADGSFYHAHCLAAVRVVVCSGSPGTVHNATSCRKPTFSKNAPISNRKYELAPA